MHAGVPLDTARVWPPHAHISRYVGSRHGCTIEACCLTTHGLQQPILNSPTVGHSSPSREAHVAKNSEYASTATGPHLCVVQTVPLPAALHAVLRVRDGSTQDASVVQSAAAGVQPTRDHLQRRRCGVPGLGERLRPLSHVRSGVRQPLLVRDHLCRDSTTSEPRTQQLELFTAVEPTATLPTASQPEPCV